MSAWRQHLISVQARHAFGTACSELIDDAQVTCVRIDHATPTLFADMCTRMRAALRADRFDAEALGEQITENGSSIV